MNGENPAMKSSFLTLGMTFDKIILILSWVPAKKL